MKKCRGKDFRRAMKWFRAMNKLVHRVYRSPHLGSPKMRTKTIRALMLGNRFFERAIGANPSQILTSKPQKGRTA